MGELAHGAEVVTDEENSATVGLGHILYFAEALGLKSSISDSEHFIDDQYLRLEVGRDREGESHMHSAAVAFDRCVEEPFHSGERDNLIEPGSDLTFFHTHDCPIEEDVLPPGEFGVESGADLEKRRDAPPQTDASTGGLCDTGQDFEKSGLPCTIASNDPEDLP